MVDGDKLIPFVRQFYSSPSKFLWEDEVGETRRIQRGEGGEQGDSLMPLLFSVGRHRALVQVQADLREGERLFAFLDDIYVVCPLRVEKPCTSRWSTHCEQKSASASIWRKQRYGMQKRKPGVADALTAAAQTVKPEALVWRGNLSLPPSMQGLKILGVPVGHPEYIVRELAQKAEEQSLLFERIPLVQDGFC